MYEKYLILTRGHYYFILGVAMNTLAILFWKQNVSPSDYIFGFNALGNSFHLETVYLLEIGYCSFTFLEWFRFLLVFWTILDTLFLFHLHISFYETYNCGGVIDIPS